MVWFPILASLAAIVPLALMAIGYLVLGRRSSVEGTEERVEPGEGQRE
jgi:surface polysaccharide O-acyltransferase-like enzyme